MTIKIGDRLICKNPGKGDYNWLQKGHSYHVKHIFKLDKKSNEEDNVLLELKEIPNVLYGPWRFEVISG